MKQYDIVPIDLVIVDLYPFEQTVASGASAEEIIEKIDIGGISLIRAGAKNFKDVVIVPSKANTPCWATSWQPRVHRQSWKSARSLPKEHLP